MGGDGYDRMLTSFVVEVGQKIMPVNLDKPQMWKGDIALSVDHYNSWFLRFAPKTYRETRIAVTKDVERMLKRTNNLRNITPMELLNHPGILPALRMSTAPPIARDRLVGLAGVARSLVEEMERNQRLPLRMSEASLKLNLDRITALITRLVDIDIFPWLAKNTKPASKDINRAATIVADRLCGANADPIVRNAQEKRQLAEIKLWLENRGYQDCTGNTTLAAMKSGMFAFRLPILGQKEDGGNVNIPVDAVIMPLKSRRGELALMVEAKSAGDYANVNKRRKEEAVKVLQLRRKHGVGVRYILFLCGYFDSGYLGYEAAEGIDWLWEHRIDDFSQFGL
jgi:hypothetical protein